MPVARAPCGPRYVCESAPERRAIALGVENLHVRKGTRPAKPIVMLTKTEELKDRIESRKHELLSKLHELKADSRKEAIEARRSVKARLDELEENLKDGWENMSDAVKTKLNEWLDR
jgi:hypothetical protein